MGNNSVFWSQLVFGSLLFDEFYDVGPDFGNVHPWKPPHQRLSVRAHQKLFEIPLDVSNFQRFPKQPADGVSEAVTDRWAGILQESENTLFVFAVHIAAFKELEVWNKSLAWTDIL